MPALPDRIDRLVHELLAVNSKLEAALREAESRPDSELLLQHAGLLKSFKGAVDHTRHLLWPYVLGSEQNAEQNIMQAMQVYRMERIKQMLTAVRRDDRASDSVKLFLSEVQRLAEQSDSRTN
ncbi:MAG: hypothetical protein M3P27_13175 [Acidobacteriota bacterium]|nr:hypothetical protein [Acidobacteriota bacterium]